jgi:PAS domain S-box-containing protein
MEASSKLAFWAARPPQSLGSIAATSDGGGSDLSRSGKPSYAELEKRMEALERELKQAPVQGGRPAGEEGLYRALFESHHTVMLLTDPETAGIIDANPAACEFYGYPREVITRMHLTDINTLPAEALFATMSRTISHPSGWQTFQHRLVGGDLREVEVYTGPVAVGGRRVLFSIVHDVTEKQAYQKTLEMSAANFKNLTENATAGILIFSPGGRLLFVNKGISEWTGHSRSDLLRAGCDGIVSAAEMEKFRAAAGRVIRKEIASHTGELTITRKDGGKLAVAVSIAKTLWEQRDAVLIMVSDISSRKSLEDRLRSSEERYRLLTECSSDIIVRHFQDGEIRFISAAVTPLLGYQPEDLVGRKILEAIMHPDDWPEMARGIRDLVQEKKKTVRLEHRVKTSAGEYLWLESTCSLLKIGGNPASCQVITVCRDISERKKFQQVLIDNRKALRALVRKRTRELGITSKNLAEANTALKVLLEKSREYGKETEERIQANLEALVLPLIQKIKNTATDPALEAPLQQLENSICQIASPFSKHLSSGRTGLTPTQIQVSDLIKSGKTSKEIAAFLNIAFKTVEAHRRNIRIKLGILNQKVNLRSYLSNLVIPLSFVGFL